MLCSTTPPASGEIVKACKCGKQYTGSGWLDLPYVGLMDSANDYTMLQLRNCPCGSTIAMEVPICANPLIGLPPDMGLQPLLAMRERFKKPSERPVIIFVMENEDG